MVTVLQDADLRHRRLAMAERRNVKQRIRAAIDAPQTAPPRLRGRTNGSSSKSCDT